MLSEVGVDMSRWRTEKHFASWLGLCPDNRLSGGKVLKRGTRHVVYRASTALRPTASALLRSQSHHRDGAHAGPPSHRDAEVWP